MVLGVGKHQPRIVRAGRLAVQDGGQRRLVRHEARREQQRRRLAVQRRKFRFQRVMRRAGAADVARAAGPGAHFTRRIAGCLHDDGMTAHREVVVRRPDQHLGAVGTTIIRKTLRLLLQRREFAVTALGTDVVQRPAAIGVESNHAQDTSTLRASLSSPFVPHASYRRAVALYVGNEVVAH